MGDHAEVIVTVFGVNRREDGLEPVSRSTSGTIQNPGRELNCSKCSGDCVAETLFGRAAPAQLGLAGHRGVPETVYFRDRHENYFLRRIKCRRNINFPRYFFLELDMNFGSILNPDIIGFIYTGVPVNASGLRMRGGTQYRGKRFLLMFPSLQGLKSAFPPRVICIWSAVAVLGWHFSRFSRLGVNNSAVVAGFCPGVGAMRWQIGEATLPRPPPSPG